MARRLAGRFDPSLRPVDIYQAVRDIMARSLTLTIADAAASFPTCYSSAYLSELEPRSPFRFACLAAERKRLTRAKGSLTGLLESWIAGGRTGPCRRLRGSRRCGRRKRRAATWMVQGEAWPSSPCGQERTMSTTALLGTTLGLGFTSGLNLYATIFITGLLIRFEWLPLPGSLEGLHVLASPVVLLVAGILYIVEFLADKIPVVDHVWDAFHTFIRPLGACLLAWRAVTGAAIPEPVAFAVILLAGGAALATHGTKASGRVAIAATGGHLAGLGVIASLVEDVGAFALAPLAIGHPIAMLVIVVVTLVVIGAMAFRIFRPRRAVDRA